MFFAVIIPTIRKIMPRRVSLMLRAWLSVVCVFGFVRVSLIRFSQVFVSPAIGFVWFVHSVPFQ